MKQAESVAQYIAAAPKQARPMVRAMRAAIRSAVPRGTEETISYGIPAFTRGGVLVWYGAFADHCSLFPKASVLKAFRKELAGYAVSKGTVQFPLDQRLPVGLIKRIVKARVAEHQARKIR
jgi:uncharacterized protein YdhG (YjbR/CyaY superfamily)